MNEECWGHKFISNAFCILLIDVGVPVGVERSGWAGKAMITDFSAIPVAIAVHSIKSALQ